MKLLVYAKINVTKFGYSNSTIEELLTRSDMLSANIPLTSETKDLIKKKELQRMKDTFIIINTSRGSIINEEDLTWAFNSNVIGGAGIVVLTDESPRISI